MDKGIVPFNKDYKKTSSQERGRDITNNNIFLFMKYSTSEAV